MDVLPTGVEGHAVSNSESERQSLFRGSVLPVLDPDAAVSPHVQLGLTAVPLARTGPLNLEMATSLRALESLKEEYERLNRVTGNGLPFALHEWHSSWCSQWLNCNPRVRDDLAIHVLRDRVGICAAIIPMVRSVRTFGPLRACSFNMLGPDPALSEIHSSLVEPGFEAPAAAAIQQHLAARSDWDWLNWGGLSPGFANYSVTTTILAEAIKYAIACGLKSVDLSPGRIVSKMRWSPREVVYEHAVQFCGGRRTQWARLLYQLASNERPALLGPLLSRFKRQAN